MDGLMMVCALGGLAGGFLGFIGSGFWEAFCLITARVGPTHDQITGLVMAGGCTGAVLALGLVVFVFVAEGA